jgi:NitT/TauT family transport system permease protein
MNRLKESLPAMAVIAALLAAWWLIVVETRSVIFPTPWQVVTGIAELIEDGTLFTHIGASLMRVGLGFSLAVLVAVPLGLWLGWVKGAYSTLNPLFQILRPISPIAWIPIAILWFGVGNASPIYLIFIASVFPMIVQTTAGVHTIERRYLRAAENFGVSRYTLFRQVVIPAVLPQIIVGMRISHHRFPQRRQSIRSGDRWHDHHRSDRIVFGWRNAIARGIEVGQVALCALRSR